MKKTFLLIGCLLVLALGITTISCKKDKKEDSKGCTCTAKYDGTLLGTEKIPESELEGMSCSELTEELWSELDDMTHEELAEAFGFAPGELPENFLDRLDINCK